MRSRGGGVHLRPLWVCLPALLAMVAGIPEAVAGCACAGGWCTCGAYDLAGGVVHLWGLRRDCPAVAVMMRACRRRWRDMLAGWWCTCGRMISGGVVCTCGPCGVIACPACHGDGVPVAGAWCACAGGWCACGAYDLRRRWVVHR
ncbi:MAG: hypothetical protein MSQ05_01310 [Akkermansia sp.]|nr:hypothetical protein [Akkermansia sp.]